MNILLILLGCNISYLLNNRINTAINFIGNFNQTNVDWFLSGGVKYPDQDTISEAEKMGKQILSYEKLFTNTLTGNRWNYIYDINSNNTAENFIMARNYIMLQESSDYFYDNIYIITSEFHFDRASQIADKILGDIHVKWILGDALLEDSLYWEKIHIRNIDSDVRKALARYSEM